MPAVPSFRRSIATVTLALAAGAVVLAGCGDKNTAPVAESTPASLAPGAQSADGELPLGGELRPTLGKDSYVPLEAAVRCLALEHGDDEAAFTSAVDALLKDKGVSRDDLEGAREAAGNDGERKDTLITELADEMRTVCPERAADGKAADEFIRALPRTEPEGGPQPALGPDGQPPEGVDPAATPPAGGGPPPGDGPTPAPSPAVDGAEAPR